MTKTLYHPVFITADLHHHHPLKGAGGALHRLQLSVKETKVLVARARIEGTTVHAALVAALTVAGQRHSEEWNAGAGTLCVLD